MRRRRSSTTALPATSRHAPRRRSPRRLDAVGDADAGQGYAARRPRPVRPLARRDRRGKGGQRVDQGSAALDADQHRPAAGAPLAALPQPCGAGARRRHGRASATMTRPPRDGRVAGAPTLRSSRSRSVG